MEAQRAHSVAIRNDTAASEGLGGTLGTFLGTRWHTDSVRGARPGTRPGGGALEGYAGRPRAGSTWAAGSAASRRPGSLSLEPRMPDPITTEPVLATASSTRTGQPSGRPTGVIPPYSMLVAAVTAATGAKDAFRASRCLRTRPLTSARVVAATMQAA